MKFHVVRNGALIVRDDTLDGASNRLLQLRRVGVCSDRPAVCTVGERVIPSAFGDAFKQYAVLINGTEVARESVLNTAIAVVQEGQKKGICSRASEQAIQEVGMSVGQSVMLSATTPVRIHCLAQGDAVPVAPVCSLSRESYGGEVGAMLNISQYVVRIGVEKIGRYGSRESALDAMTMIRKAGICR